MGVNAAEAVRLYRVGAEAGDDYAMFRLARCLETGLGVSAPDVDAAFVLYTAAAARGYPAAIHNLGACYAAGRGVARDLPRAVTLWQRVLAHPQASQSDVAIAAGSLGVSLMPGDPVRGVLFLRRAAAAGNESAARCLRDLGLPLRATSPPPPRAEAGR